MKSQSWQRNRMSRTIWACAVALVCVTTSSLASVLPDGQPLPSSFPTAAGMPVAILVAILAVLAVNIVLVFALVRNRWSHLPKNIVPGTIGQGMAFPELSERVQSLQRDVLTIASGVNSTAARLGDFQRELRVFVGTSYSTRQNLENQYATLLSSVLSILDYVEALQNSDETLSAEQLSGVRSRSEQSLQDLGIGEISVNLGEPFSGEFHKQVLRRHSIYPPGTVAEVVRRGWSVKARQPGFPLVLIRPAEVIISAGPPPTEERPFAEETNPEAQMPSEEKRSETAPSPSPSRPLPLEFEETPASDTANDSAKQPLAPKRQPEEKSSELRRSYQHDHPIGYVLSILRRVSTLFKRRCWRDGQTRPSGQMSPTQTGFKEEAETKHEPWN